MGNQTAAKNYLSADGDLSLNRPWAAGLSEEQEFWQPIDWPEAGPKEIKEVLFVHLG